MSSRLVYPVPLLTPHLNVRWETANSTCSKPNYCPPPTNSPSVEGITSHSKVKARNLGVPWPYFPLHLTYNKQGILLIPAFKASPKVTTNVSVTTGTSPIGKSIIAPELLHEGLLAGLQIFFSHSPLRLSTQQPEWVSKMKTLSCQVFKLPF